MTEKEMNNALDMIGALLTGEINIRKSRGSDDILVTTKMHPFLAFYLIAQALEEMLWRTGETGDYLQIDLSNGNARKILNGITSLIANDIERALEKKGENNGQSKLD